MPPTHSDESSSDKDISDEHNFLNIQAREKTTTAELLKWLDFKSEEIHHVSTVFCTCIKNNLLLI